MRQAYDAKGHRIDFAILAEDYVVDTEIPTPIANYEMADGRAVSILAEGDRFAVEVDGRRTQQGLTTHGIIGYLVNALHNAEYKVGRKEAAPTRSGC